MDEPRWAGTEDGLMRALDAGDWIALGLWADYLLENNDPREPGVRALIRLGRVPHKTDHRGVVMWGFHDGTGLIRTEGRLGIIEQGGRNPFPLLPPTPSTEMLAPREHELPEPWYLACWSPEKGDREEILANWLTSDTAARVIGMAVEAFAILPRWLRTEYVTGVDQPTVPCPRGILAGHDAGCARCFLSGRLTAVQCPGCEGRRKIKLDGMYLWGMQAYDRCNKCEGLGWVAEEA